MITRRSFIHTAALAGTSRAIALDHWPQFRGAESLGVAEDDPRLPETWSTAENVVWKTPVAGRGWASPVVWGDKIFLLSAISAGPVEAPKKGLYFGGNRPQPPEHEYRWMGYCLDFKKGAVIWERELYRGIPKAARHLKNSYASETPLTDGERVYFHVGHLGTYCFDHAGRKLWEKAWPAYKMREGWGTASSPASHEGRLYIVNDNDDEAFLVALDETSGKEIWRVERDEKSNWATPYIWANDRRTEIITCGTNKVRSYDLDGKLLWELGKMSSIVIPTPFSGHGLLYVTSGFVGDETRPVFAIRPGASGDISLKPGQKSNEYIAWFKPQAGPYNPSPLVYGDHYYTLFDRGFFTCHDARTGKEIYGKRRLDVESNAFAASPWAYNSKIFCLSEDGDTYVIQAGSEYKMLGKNSLDEMCMSTPAIAQGSLLIRTGSRLYRIQKA